MRAQKFLTSLGIDIRFLSAREIPTEYADELDAVLLELMPALTLIRPSIYIFPLMSGYGTTIELSISLDDQCFTKLLYEVYILRLENEKYTSIQVMVTTLLSAFPFTYGTLVEVVNCHDPNKLTSPELSLATSLFESIDLPIPITLEPKEATKLLRKLLPNGTYLNIIKATEYIATTLQSYGFEVFYRYKRARANDKIIVLIPDAGLAPRERWFKKETIELCKKLLEMLNIGKLCLKFPNEIVSREDDKTVLMIEKSVTKRKVLVHKLETEKTVEEAVEDVIKKVIERGVLKPVPFRTVRVEMLRIED